MAISSRKSVPPDAASNRPGFARRASVKDPASNPNSSASSIVSGIAAQLTGMNGPAARGPLSWMMRATSPLPVPVSPWTRKVGTIGPPIWSNAASLSIWARSAWMTGAAPMRRALG